MLTWMNAHLLDDDRVDEMLLCLPLGFLSNDKSLFFLNWPEKSSLVIIISVHNFWNLENHQSLASKQYLFWSDFSFYLKQNFQRGGAPL
jgi:hypothetical protein